jgi:uncharacterized protein (TIGR02118 family)
LIKSIMVAHRKPGMTPEEFNRYWKDVHAPLAARLIPSYMKKYVQNHLIRLPGHEYEGDGIVEMWWDNLEAHQEYHDWIMTEAARELREDGDRFCDISHSKMWLVEEHIIKE